MTFKILVVVVLCVGLTGYAAVRFVGKTLPLIEKRAQLARSI